MEEKNGKPIKVLHILLPEESYWHLQQCAIESRMSLKDYMAELGRNARPFVRDTADPNSGVSDATDASISKAA